MPAPPQVTVASPAPGGPREARALSLSRFLSLSFSLSLALSLTHTLSLSRALSLSLSHTHTHTHTLSRALSLSLSLSLASAPADARRGASDDSHLLRFRVQGTGVLIMASGFGIRGWDSGFGFGVRDSGLGFGIRVWDSGFGFGIRVWVSGLGRDLPPEVRGRGRELDHSNHLQQLLWFRRGLVSKAHRLVYHSTLGLRVIKKKRRAAPARFGRRSAGGADSLTTPTIFSSSCVARLLLLYSRYRS